MGIFQSRPEEPDEWAGLPSEPWQPRVPGEVLPPAIDDLSALGTDGTSLTVPIDVHAAAIATVADAPAPDADGD